MNKAADHTFDSYFARFGNLKVIVLGDVMLDVFTYGENNRQSPEAPVPIIDVADEVLYPGGAANVANNLKSLGVEPYLISAIGADQHGDQLIKLLNDSGISTNSIEKVNDRSTTKKHRVIVSGAHRMRVDYENAKDLAVNVQALLINHFDELISEVDGVILQDYNKGVLTESLIRHVMDKSREANKPVFVDPKFDQFFTYQDSFLFKPNWREVCEALDLTDRQMSSKNINEAVKALFEKINCTNLIITLGKAGICYASKGVSDYSLIDGLEVLVNDVSGAGDSVISILTACMLSEMPIGSATTVANLSGKIACSQSGIYSVTLTDLKKGIKAHQLLF